MMHKLKYRDKLKWVLGLSLLICTCFVETEAQTRDPRFYSRPGVDYHWPNPGDPDYRWVIIAVWLSSFSLTF